MTAQRAAADEPLEFVTAGDGRVVHVVAADPAAPADVEAVGFAAQLAKWMPLLGRTGTLCGAVIHRDLGTGGGTYISAFTDDRLCRRCHRALGNDGDRAFEHPIPTEEVSR